MLKKTLPIIASAMILGVSMQAQERVIGFEDLLLTPNANYLMFNEEDLEDGPTIIISYDEEEEIKINLHGDIDYGFLAGFDVSNVTDESYNDYSFPLAAQPFSGANGTENYAVGFVNIDFMGEDPSITIPLEATFENIPDDYVLDHLYISNGIIAYNYIQSNYPHQEFYLDLVINGYNGDHLIDSIIVSLADYRNNAAQVLDDWLKVELNTLANADRLTFDLRSNDNEGGYGINTPAYFAMDEITFVSTISVNEIQAKNLKIYPNPTNGLVHFSDEVYHFNLINNMGQSVIQSEQMKQLDMTALPAGVYYMNFELSNGKPVTQSIIKQ